MYWQECAMSGTDATLSQFAVLTSAIHMAWLRA